MAELYDQDKGRAELACPYCEMELRADDKCCSALHPERLLGCTKRPGHDGAHVACGTGSHLMAFWA